MKDWPLYLFLAGVAYMVLRPQPSKADDTAKLMTELAKLVAAVAVLKGALGKAQATIDALKKRVGELHAISDGGAVDGLDY